MVMTAQEAGRKYQTGVEIFGGYDVYRRCGENKGRGFLAVASCLEAAKKVSMTTANMVAKYMAAAGGA